MIDIIVKNRYELSSALRERERAYREEGKSLNNRSKQPIEKSEISNI